MQSLSLKHVMRSMEEFNPEEYVVRRIEAKEAREFVEEWHYSKSMPNSMFIFGMFCGVELVGVMTFGTGANFNLLKSIARSPEYKTFEKVSLELTRLCLKDEIGKNSESWFISKCFSILKQKGYKFIVSFSDPYQKHLGGIYQATNFFYVGIGVAGGGRDYRFKGTDKWIHSRSMFAKYGYSGYKNITKKFPDIEVRKFSQKHKYIYILTKHPKERKYLISCMKRANNRIRPYPKVTK